MATASAVFSWGAQDQAQYYIEYKENALGATVYTTGWIASTVSQHTFPANTFTMGKEYAWRVKVKNNFNEESSFSEWEIFKAGDKTTLNLLVPTQFQVITSWPTYQHDYVDPNNIPQLFYRYRLWSRGLTWNQFDLMTAEQQESMTWDELELYGATLLYDTGEVYSTAESHVQPPGYFPSLADYYRLRLNVKNTAGGEFQTDITTFQLNLSGVPWQPSITTTSDDETGSIAVSVFNPEDNPPLSHNIIFRSEDGASYVPIANNVAVNGTYYDLTPASGKTYYYAAAAVNTNGVQGPLSTAKTGVVNLAGYVISDPDTGKSWTIETGVELKPVISERDRLEQVGLDATYPIVTYGKKRFWRGGLQGYLIEDYENIQTTAAQLASLRDLVDAASKKPLILRTPAGEVYRVDIYNFQYSLAFPNDYGRIVSFEFVQVSD